MEKVRGLAHQVSVRGKVAPPAARLLEQLKENLMCIPERNLSALLTPWFVPKELQ